MKRILAGLILAIAATGALWAEDYQKILEKVDSLASYMDTDYGAEYTIVEDKGQDGREKTVAVVFRRDKQEKYVIIVTEPEVNKGQGYLKVDEALWFYDPESSRFNFTKSSERFQNTNARNSDFTRSTLAQDYNVDRVSEVKLGRYDCWKMRLVANNDEVTYPVTEIWVDQNYLVRKTLDYGLSGELMRTTAFPSYQTVQGRYVPHKILQVDALSREKTQITIDKVSFKDLAANTFTKPFLEKVNK
jgi:outer membrane lipoprotein-sorting protein